jgi:hypothetical protein
MNWRGREGKRSWPIVAFAGWAVVNYKILSQESWSAGRDLSAAMHTVPPCNASGGDVRRI